MRQLVPLALVLVGCGAGQRPELPPPARCLEGPLPELASDRQGAERVALFRREVDRARAASPVVAARILEQLPPLSPSFAFLPAPDCRRELAAQSAAVMTAGSLSFDRLSLARIRLTSDPETLLDLAERARRELKDPARSEVRAAALARLGWFSTELRDRAIAEVLASRGAVEQLAAMRTTHTLLGRRLKFGQGNALIRAWLDDVDRALDGPADPRSLELVLARFDAIAELDRLRFWVSRFEAPLRRVLDARGRLPITGGDRRAARDLADAAFFALANLERPSNRSPRPLPPRRAPVADEPGGEEPTAAEVAARIVELDGELARLRDSFAARCHVIRELGRWLPEPVSAERLATLVAPVFDGESIRLSTETLCRVGVGIRLAGAPEPDRRRLLLTLLQAGPAQIGKRDRSGDPSGPSVSYRYDPNPVTDVAARALADNLEWVDRDAALRAWLAAEARRPIPTESPLTEDVLALQPALVRLIEFHLGPGGDRTEARALLAAWMASIDAAEDADVTHVYHGEVIRWRLRALGDLGRRAGLAREVAAFLGTRTHQRAAGAALYQLSFDDDD